ncbi:MAG: hypothetical protein PUE49_04670 [Eggerthellales bacterium]|nr:hypothetical protein [Eggerthellales bacterium]
MVQFALDNLAGSMQVSVTFMGDDCCIAIYGGDKPHVGCTVLAVPRPSLTGQGTSATVSVLNATGHKDDFLATAVAKEVASRTNSTVTCCAGVHVDNATPQIIESIVQSASQIADIVISTREEQSL